MYIQIVIFLKLTFFSEGIQQTNEQTKQERYFDEANEKSDNYCKWFMDQALNKKNLFVNFDNTPLPSCLHTFTF